MTFTDGQWKSLAIVPHFTSALSMMGDAWIIFDILWRRRRNNTTKKLSLRNLVDYFTKSLSSYHRIIMLMSTWDFIVITLGKFPASWAMPADTPNVYYAIGSRQSCTMQGFFIQFSLIVPIYNAMTALYYLLVVHYGLSNRVIRQKYEKWMHICPFVVASSFAIVGLVPSMLLYHVALLNEVSMKVLVYKAECIRLVSLTQLFFSRYYPYIMKQCNKHNKSTMWCWMNAEPKGCIQSYEGQGPTTCTRGDNAYVYRLALYYAPIWSCIVFATVSMVVVYNTVRVQEAKAKRFHANRFNFEGGSGGRERRAATRTTKKKQVARQAYFYVGGFLMVWIFPTLNRVLAFFSISFYPLVLLHAIFSPLQGFVNFIVYMRPRLLQHIEHYERVSMDLDDGKGSTLKAIGSFFFFIDEKKEEKEAVAQENDNRKDIVQTGSDHDIVHDRRESRTDDDDGSEGEVDIEKDDAEDYGAYVRHSSDQQSRPGSNVLKSEVRNTL